MSGHALHFGSWQRFLGVRPAPLIFALFTLSGILITEPAAQLAPAFTIRGRVTDAQGVPIAMDSRAQLRLFSADGIRSGQGTQDGKFVIGDLPRGDYELEVRVPGFAPHIVPGLHVASDLEPWPIVMQIDFTYDCMHPVHILYEKSTTNAGSLTGKVSGPGELDATTIVVVRSADKTTVATLKPDAGGEFSVALPAGKYAVRAIRKGDLEQQIAPVWITRTTVTKVAVPFPDPNGGITVCQ